MRLLWGIIITTKVYHETGEVGNLAIYKKGLSTCNKGHRVLKFVDIGINIYLSVLKVIFWNLEKISEMWQ